MELNKVYNIDFLNNDLPDKCAKLIIADPPYYKTKGAFDFIWKTFDYYLIDVEKWCLECKRILADNGTLLWYGDAKNIAYSQIIFDKHFNLINSVVWENTNQAKQSMVNVEEYRSFPPLTERILIYSNEEDNFVVDHLQKYLLSEFIKCAKPVSFYKKLCGFTGNQPYNWFTPKNNGSAQWAFPKKEHYIKLSVTGFFLKEYEELKAEYEELKAKHEELRRPFNNIYKVGDVIRLPNYETSDYDHDTIKPEKLTRILITTCSRENDLVIVPFAGSGTECAMSAKEKRAFIGYEITKKHAEMSQKRANKILSEPTMF